MQDGLIECQKRLERYIVYNEVPDVCEFKHEMLIDVQKRLKRTLEFYRTDDFALECAKFIAEGMDYICNTQLEKKSCDVIYQYQYILRSEYFVNERQEILDELLPLIRELKEKKFSMTQTKENWERINGDEQLARMLNAVNIDKVPDQKQLSQL